MQLQRWKLKISIVFSGRKPFNWQIRTKRGALDFFNDHATTQWIGKTKKIPGDPSPKTLALLSRENFFPTLLAFVYRFLPFLLPFFFGITTHRRSARPVRPALPCTHCSRAQSLCWSLFGKINPQKKLFKCSRYVRRRFCLLPVVRRLLFSLLLERCDRIGRRLKH